MGILDSVSSWFDSNKSWLKPIVGGASKIFDTWQGSQGRNDYSSALKGAIDSDYARQKEMNDAIAAYNGQAAAYGARQAAAANAAANARASAAAATEKNRQAAAKKAQKGIDKVYAETMALYKPFGDTAKNLLPGMSSTYTSGLENMGKLSQLLFSPQGIGKLQQSKAATSVDVPLPDWMKRKQETKS